MISPYQQELLIVRMTLGELTFAHRAVAAFYHIQDPATGELIQIPFASPEPWHARITRKMLFKWHHSTWMKPVSGVIAGIVVVCFVGVAQSWRERLNVAIPIAQAPRMEPKDLAIVEDAYQQEIEREYQSQPVSNQLLNPLPQVLSQKIQPNASRVPTVTPSQIQPPEIKTQLEVKTSDAKQTDSLSIVNELPVDAKQTTKANVTPSNERPTVPPTFKPQLVAIQDAKTILVTAPNSRLPAKLSIGGVMSDGRRLEKIDPLKGVASFEDGSIIRLE